MLSFSRLLLGTDSLWWEKVKKNRPLSSDSFSISLKCIVASGYLLIGWNSLVMGSAEGYMKEFYMGLETSWWQGLCPIYQCLIYGGHSILDNEWMNEWRTIWELQGGNPMGDIGNEETVSASFLHWTSWESPCFFGFIWIEESGRN